MGIARNHHEWWDGSGFPDKLAGENIPLCARMMAIANAFDVLVFKHHNNTPVPFEEALKIIQKESGTHFDPILALEFLKIREGLNQILRIAVFDLTRVSYKTLFIYLSALCGRITNPRKLKFSPVCNYKEELIRILP